MGNRDTVSRGAKGSSKASGSGRRRSRLPPALGKQSLPCELRDGSSCGGFEQAESYFWPPTERLKARLVRVGAGEWRTGPATHGVKPAHLSASRQESQPQERLTALEGRSGTGCLSSSSTYTCELWTVKSAFHNKKIFKKKEKIFLNHVQSMAATINLCHSTFCLKIKNVNLGPGTVA